jgi:transposase
MVIIGCDFHPSGQQVLAIESQTGELVSERWLDHANDEAEQFYASLPAGAVVGVESSGNMLWFERLLNRYGHKLRIGDAARIRAMDLRKQKHDGRDAATIAQLLLEDRFPDLKWVPSLAQRDQRQLLMHRHKLVRMRTQIKNQLQHIAMNQGIRKKQRLWSASGRQLLLDLKLDPWTARRRDDLLELLDTLDQHCQKLDVAVQQAAEQNADARLLMLHPGIGPVISFAFVLTIGDVSRFDNSRQVVSYLGLNPAEYSSGERRRLGRISKQGSVFMRMLLIQGAQTAVRGDEALARQYRRLTAKKNRATAKVMVARKLAVRMFWILKTKARYPEVVRMQGSSSHSVVNITERLCEHPASQQS